MNQNKIETFVIEPEDANIRLDTFLSQQQEFLSRSQIQNLIEKKQVYVNSQIVKPSYKVKNDDEIAVELSEDFDVIIYPENIPIEIISSVMSKPISS